MNGANIHNESQLSQELIKKDNLLNSAYRQLNNVKSSQMQAISENCQLAHRNTMLAKEIASMKRQNTQLRKENEVLKAEIELLHASIASSKENKDTNMQSSNATHNHVCHIMFNMLYIILYLSCS